MIMADNKNLSPVLSVYHIPEESPNSVIHSLLPPTNQNHIHIGADIPLCLQSLSHLFCDNKNQNLVAFTKPMDSAQRFVNKTVPIYEKQTSIIFHKLPRIN